MHVEKKIIAAGALLGGFAVLTGAFGAHALKPVLLENNRVETFELAVRYQFYHALLLLIIGALKTVMTQRILYVTSLLIFVGTAIFSGSLYILSLSGVTYWGAVTPFGGIFIAVGWLLLAVTMFRSSPQEK